MPGASTQEIGRYRVLTELGQGGTANVFLAVASGIEGFSKLVVLKRMKPQLVGEPGFAAMFLDEARLAARLSHSNIVQTNEVFKDGELPVIVMEYLEGQTLANIVAHGDRNALPLAAHLSIVSDVLNGLQYSHDLCDFDGKPLDVVHRDVTPHNVFVTFDGNVKVLDFGIAKLGSSLVETESGVIKGKLRYIPPEQIAGEPIDRRADIYAVGVMLWEAATGDKMWRGLSDATIMNRVINGEIPSPTAVRPTVAEALERTIMKALSPEREDRHATAVELQQELDRYRESLPERGNRRDLAAMMEKLFSSQRAERQRTIEQHLSTTRLSQPLRDRSSDHSTPSNYSVSDARPPATVPESRRSALWIALLAGLVATGLWFASTANRASEQTISTAAVATEKARVEADPPPEVEPIEVRLTASPPEARLWLDGVPLEDNPYFDRQKPDNQLHEVVARARGYEDVVRSVRFDRSRELFLRLSRVPLPATQPSSTPPPSKKSPSNESPKRKRIAAPNPQCEPPYVVDPRGIKRFKPECVR